MDPKNISDDDRKWVVGGSGCVVAGLVATLVTKSWTWFAVGAVTGASVVGTRLYYKMNPETATGSSTTTITSEVHRAAQPPRSPAAYPADILGAPIINPQDTSPANKPRLLSRAEVRGFPMRHRVPECDAQALPMDPRGYSGLKDDIKRVW
jgi:hypothetical protein